MTFHTQIDVPALAKEKKQRKDKVLPPIIPTGIQRTDLGLIYLAPIKAGVAMLRADLLPAFETGANNDQLKASQGNFEARMAAALTAAIALLLPFFSRLDIWQLTRWTAILKSNMSIDVSAILHAHETIELIDTAATANAGLMEGVTNSFKQRVDAILWQAVSKRRFATPDPQELSRALDDAVEITKRRARNTARDQVNTFVANLNEFRQRQAGITEYQWDHTPQPHPRHWHVARQGKVFSWDKPPFDGHPGSLPYCKCGARAVVRIN